MARNLKDKTMAKITRKHQKIFAGDVPVTNVVAEFGSLAAGAAAYSSDPDDIQSTRYSEGWGEAVINNFAPCIQDLNALFNLITRQLAYIFQAGIPEWLTNTTYYIGSLVHDADGGIYMSIVDDNNGNALTIAGKWMPIYSRKISLCGSSLEGDYTVSNTDWMVIWDGTKYGVPEQYVILPTPSASNTGREILVKMTGSDYNGTPRVKANDDSTLDGAAYIQLVRYTTRRFISNGTNWIPIN